MKRAQADQTYAQFKRALGDIYGNDKEIYDISGGYISGL